MDSKSRSNLSGQSMRQVAQTFAVSCSTAKRLVKQYQTFVRLLLVVVTTHDVTLSATYLAHLKTLIRKREKKKKKERERKRK
jgi:hypothetical protein